MIPDELLPSNSVKKLAKFITKLNKPEIYVLKRFMSMNDLDDAMNEILEDALATESEERNKSINLTEADEEQEERPHKRIHDDDDDSDTSKYKTPLDMHILTNNDISEIPEIPNSQRSSTF